jgi:ketosteroid isomerase-like protein
MSDAEQELLDLKERALTATRERDQAFYQDYLADDAVAVLPAGVFGKAAVVAALAGPQVSFQSSAVQDTQVTVLGPDAGVVTYRAVLTGGTVFVTTVYARRDGRWRGVLYQQTPLPG